MLFADLFVFWYLPKDDMKTASSDDINVQNINIRVNIDIDIYQYLTHSGKAKISKENGTVF